MGEADSTPRAGAGKSKALRGDEASGLWPTPTEDRPSSIVDLPPEFKAVAGAKVAMDRLVRADDLEEATLAIDELARALLGDPAVALLKVNNVA